MLGSLDNFKLGMGLSAVPFQKLPSKYASLDGLDGASGLLTPKNLLIALVIVVLLKKFV